MYMYNLYMHTKILIHHKRARMDSKVAIYMYTYQMQAVSDQAKYSTTVHVYDEAPLLLTCAQVEYILTDTTATVVLLHHTLTIQHHLIHTVQLIPIYD